MICNIENCKEMIDDAATIKTLENLNALGEHFGRYVARRIGEASNKKAGYRYFPAFDPANTYDVAYAAKEEKFAGFVQHFLTWADEEYPDN